MGTSLTVETRTEPPQTGQGAAILVASFGAFLAFLDATIVNVCFPAIEETFSGSSTSALSWVLNSYNIVFAAMLIAGGRLADLLGRRRIFVIGVVVFTVASVLCAVAGSLGMLIFWRVVQALGAALLVPASLGIVIKAVPDERRSHAVSLWGASAALAAGLGPPIGGLLIELSSWRLAFLVNLPLGIAAIALTMRVVRESRSPGRRQLPDLLGVALLVAALGLLSLAIVRGPDWGWTSTSGLLSLAGAAVLLVFVGRRILTHPAPVLDPTLLRQRPFLVANLATLVAGMGMYAYLLNHILWLSYVWDYSLLQAGFAVAPSALMTAVSAAILGGVAQRVGYRVVALGGAVVWALGLWWFVERVGVSPAYVSEWLPGALISGAGAGAVLPILGSAGVATVAGGRYALASSVMSATRQLGGVLGIAFLIAIVGSASPSDPLGAIEMFRDGWWFSFGCFVATGVFVLALTAGSEPVDEGAPPSRPPLVRARPSGVETERGFEEASSFQDLLPGVSDALLAQSRRIELPAGSTLFEEDTVGTAIYVLLAGRVQIVKGGAMIRELGQGSMIGELAVLAGQPRAAGVVAVRDSVLLEIDGDAARDALAASPQAALAIAGALAAQIRTLSPPPARRPEPTTIALLAEHGPAPVDVAAELARRIGAHRRVATVTESIDAAALAALEADHDRVLLVAGAQPDDQDWRAFCARQADSTVVVVADQDRPVGLYPGSELLLRGRTNHQAVCSLHERTGARRVHVEEEGGVDALAARLAGTSVGLALAGGGARAFSHVGALYEIEAAAIPVHRVAGTSVGSYVGALYAAGWAVADIELALREEFVDRNPLGDYGLPRYALTKGRRVAAATKRVYGSLQAEGLPRELTVMATDLMTRESVALTTGPLADITRASAAVPGLLPPVRIGDRILVDGAVTGNLPVQPLTAESVGPVWAVDLAVGAGEARTPKTSTQRRMPTIGETMMRTLLFAAGDADRAAAATADLVVTTQTRGIGLLEFHQIDEAILAGRASGRALVEAIEASRASR